MTEYSPLVLISGAYSQLPPGDSVTGIDAGTVTPGSGLGGGGNLNTGDVSIFIKLSTNPSGLIFADNRLGFDGVSIVNASAASASGNLALSNANTALASGNSALSLSAVALASGNAALSALGSASSGANSAIFTASGPLLPGTPVGFDNRGFVQAVRGTSPTNNGFNNFLGVSRSAAASGSSVTIDLPDTVVINQTGLTTGSIYYVNPTTSGFTTASGRPASWTGAIPWGPVGRAVSSSGLLLFNIL